MRLAVFGGTGALGGEVVRQALAAGHTVAVLVRHPARFDSVLAGNDGVEVVAGDALVGDDVDKVLAGADGVIFALGMNSKSPPLLCTRATALIVERIGTRRFVWCGGGSNLVDGDPDTFGGLLRFAPPSAVTVCVHACMRGRAPSHAHART
jgi:putative NADH-flavin reductase